MIPATSTDVTIGQVLFPAADASAEIERELDARAALKRLTDGLGWASEPLLSAVSREVASVVAGLLEMDLVDVLVAGWRKYRALVDAAQRTLHTPAERAAVDLATHTIASTYPSHVDVLVHDVRVGTIDVEVDLEIVLRGVVGVVAGGRLTALRSGLAEVEVGLSCEGVELRSARREFDLRLGFDLGDGIPLVEPPSYVTLP